MLRDLLDALRCPHDHDETWLVAMVHRADGPMLRDADLACPVCGAEFALRDGEATFADAGRPATVALAVDGPVADPVRLAALLGVVEGTLPVLLAGVRTCTGGGLAELVPVPQLWVNAPDTLTGAPPLTSRLRLDERLPLGVATLAAAAIDGAHASPTMLAGLVRAIRPGGRLLAPVITPLPAGVRELARDDHEWVAEVTARASGLVELRRRAPDQVG